MAGVLGAQQTAERPPQTAPQQTPPSAQFAAGVDVVQVDVSVTDKSGQPITDLTARDFDVREDGQPQTIQTIYLATLDRTILKATPAAPGSPAITANGLERHELKQRVFIFVLDMTHLSAAGFTRSRDAIAGFIEDVMTPADVDGVEAAKIARNDERTIANATERACREQPGDCSGAGGDAGVRQQIESKGQRIAAETQRDTSLTLTALESLANGLARLPGPKQVAVFSEGFYTDDTSAWLK